MMAMSSENMALAAAGGGGWGGMGGGVDLTRAYPGFLSGEQKKRLERIRQMRLLFDGCHEQYYLREGRTRFDFPYVRTNGFDQKLYVTLNILGLISLKTADLLFGQAPLLDCEDETQWEALHDLARRTQLHSVLLNGAIAGSAEGEVFFEAMIHSDGQLYVCQVPNEEIFPIGTPGPDGQYTSYVRYLLKNIGTDQSPLWLLLETLVAAGSITRTCWQLDENRRKSKPVDLSYFDPALEPLTVTGLNQPTIVWIPNIRGKACSDYECAIDLQDKLNAKETQIARVLQKHADPKLAAPEAAVNPNSGSLEGSAGEVIFFRNADDVPRYITWNAELASATTERDRSLSQLLVRTETSPSLLGLKDGAAPDAYKKVRLESFNSLAKASRKAIDWTAGVQRLLDVAQALDNTRPGVSYPHGEDSPVGVTLRDGIPVDENDQATTIATLRAAGVLSRYRGVQLQLGDEAAVDAEMQELAKEDAASAPSVLIGNTEIPTGDSGAGQKNESQPEGAGAAVPQGNGESPVGTPAPHEYGGGS